jgi:hypothetical protein
MEGRALSTECYTKLATITLAARFVQTINFRGIEKQTQDKALII